MTTAYPLLDNGWTKLEMAERYTRKADRSRLGGALSGGFGLEDGDE